MPLGGQALLLADRPKDAPGAPDAFDGAPDGDLLALISNDSPSGFPQSWQHQQALWQAPEANGRKGQQANQAERNGLGGASAGLQSAPAAEPAAAPRASAIKQLPGAKPATAPLHYGLSALGASPGATAQASAPLAQPQSQPQPQRARPGGSQYVAAPHYQGAHQGGYGQHQQHQQHLQHNGGNGAGMHHQHAHHQHQQHQQMQALQSSL